MPARTGRVVAFDPRRGLGTVEGSDGEVLEFHCTQVADGTRSVPVDATVRYVVVPGSLGRWEAAAVDAISSASAVG
jgi:cold shock CspA family protein